MDQLYVGPDCWVRPVIEPEGWARDQSEEQERIVANFTEHINFLFESRQRIIGRGAMAYNFLFRPNIDEKWLSIIPSFSNELAILTMICLDFNF